MRRYRSAVGVTASLLGILTLVAGRALAQEARTYFNPSAKPIPAGSKIYIAPIPGGFENYIAAGIMRKKVPVVIVKDRDKADYEISGVSETENANWAKMFFMGSAASKEQASIQVVDLKLGEVVFAYSVHKANSARGKQSVGEACAKHLKSKINGE
jgi:hypothetical protein